MQPLYQELQSVVVTAKKPVVIIKTDTIEFVTSAFKTEKNATVEDIFKKIPGVEVNKNGTIKAMGEVVTQIYVDGKPFFGNDLKAVTQNFPADVIDKIEIIDKKNDQALETKVDDGSFERIINITLKKNSKKGVFGKDYIGYGASNRYEAKANANLFNDDEKLSAIAGLNNTGSYDGSSTNNNNFSNAENRQVKISYANKIRNNFDFSACLLPESTNKEFRRLHSIATVDLQQQVYHALQTQVQVELRLQLSYHIQALDSRHY